MNSITLLIKLYQKLLSPLLGNGKCRFHPVCSHYAIRAFKNYSFFKALYLSTVRILKCNMFFVCGVHTPLPKVNHRIVKK